MQLVPGSMGGVLSPFCGNRRKAYTFVYIDHFLSIFLHRKLAETYRGNWKQASWRNEDELSASLPRFQINHLGIERGGFQSSFKRDCISCIICQRTNAGAVHYPYIDRFSIVWIINGNLRRSLKVICKSPSPQIWMSTSPRRLRWIVHWDVVYQSGFAPRVGVWVCILRCPYLVAQAADNRSQQASHDLSKLWFTENTS